MLQRVQPTPSSSRQTQDDPPVSSPQEVQQHRLGTNYRDKVVGYDVLFQDLVIPRANVSWRSVAALCGRTIAPICNSLQNILSEDVERLSQVFFELETPLDEGIDFFDVSGLVVTFPFHHFSGSCLTLTTGFRTVYAIL